ncbi:MAG TPA: ABC transporter permease [Bryobacteraceae bacterium]|nr:ABC transporter permease [Bryobacteraceae bacterium]
MKLAIQNILHDRVRFAVATAGIAFAAFLMTFQGSLLNGFLTAASKVVDATDSDIWITARGVTCFDFSARLGRRFIEMARMVPGVASISRVGMGFLEFRKPGGLHQVVALIGADPNTGLRFPAPTIDGATKLANDGVLIDRSSAALFNIPSLPWDTEINGHRVRVLREIEGFSSFLGSPYVFSSYEDAARWLGFGPQDAMYVLIRLEPGLDSAAFKSALQARIPDVQVWTKAEFSKQARAYWLQQTGAGGTVMTSAVLGFIIGLLIVSQTIYAATMENIEEFATLKALGASRAYIAKVVLTQALTCGVAGCSLAMIVSGPAIRAARAAVSWILMPDWLPLAMFIPGLLMCAAASLISARKAMVVDPGKVFRV